MDKKTIEDLYYGRLHPLDVKLCEEVCRTQEKGLVKGAEGFAKKLPAALRQEFANICKQEAVADESLHREAFIQGFQLGLRLAAECYGPELGFVK